MTTLGNPHEHLPPVIHVAGTNAKGSTIAYLRAFLEAAGQSVHVYNSPHLVRFNERIRLAGKLVGTRRLNAVLERVERVNAGAPDHLFRGHHRRRLCALSPRPRPITCCSKPAWAAPMTPPMWSSIRWAPSSPRSISTTRRFLGPTIADIAVSKAGILKRGSKAVIGLQQEEGRAVIDRAARRLGITPIWQGEDFHGSAQDGRLVYQDEDGLLDLPPPALLGAHQFDNAALAIAAARHFGLPVDAAAIATRPAQRRLAGPHDAAAQGPAARPARARAPNSGSMASTTPMAPRPWPRALRDLDHARPAPLVLIMGLMNTRDPADGPRALCRHGAAGSDRHRPGRDQCPQGSRPSPPQRVGPALTPGRALRDLGPQGSRPGPNARVLICGSLYLAGDVLASNRTPPD